MPLYEYECKSCGTRFEQLIFNRETKVTCKACGGKKVTQLLSTFSIASAGAKSMPVMETGPCGACGAPERGMCATEN